MNWGGWIYKIISDVDYNNFKQQINQMYLVAKYIFVDIKIA